MDLVNGLTPALCSTRPTPSLRLVQSVVCSFVLYPILPMDLGPQRCSRYRFEQPVRRRLTFGPSEDSACTSRPWVVMTTQIRTAAAVPVCACVFEFCAQLCACVFEFLCQVVRMRF